MKEAKIHLSPAEQELMCNASVILTKNEVLRKVKEMLEDLAAAMTLQEEARYGSRMPDVLLTPPKVSRGENYRGLPYLVLDYPRVFRGGDIFAIRTFFWWGHFFSSTLHLAGSYKREAEPLLMKALSGLADEGYYISCSDDPWQHHFEAGNYRELAGLSQEERLELLRQRDYIKIAAKWPLEGGLSAANDLWNSWKRLLEAGLG